MPRHFLGKSSVPKLETPYPGNSARVEDIVRMLLRRWSDKSKHPAEEAVAVLIVPRTLCVLFGHKVSTLPTETKLTLNRSCLSSNLVY